MTEMAQPQSDEPRGSRQWLAPLAGMVLVVLALAAVIVLARKGGETGAPPAAGEFQRPVQEDLFAIYTVLQVTGGQIRFALADGAPAPDVAIPDGARVEMLGLAEASDVQPGDWVSVIGVTNEVRNFAIRFLVVIPGGAPAADGIVRSPGGFAGHEANVDAAEAPLTGGRVVSVSGSSLALEGPSGAMTIALSEDAPLLRLVEGSVTGIREGDRVAFPASGGRADPAAGAVLVGHIR